MRKNTHLCYKEATELKTCGHKDSNWLRKASFYCKNLGELNKNENVEISVLKIKNLLVFERYLSIVISSNQITNCSATTKEIYTLQPT